MDCTCIHFVSRSGRRTVVECDVCKTRNQAMRRFVYNRYLKKTESQPGCKMNLIAPVDVPAVVNAFL